METLVANLTGKTRKVSRNGVEYVVAPMTLIVPGVLNGSLGPLLYPPDEIARSVQTWNGLPLTLGHPQDTEGQYVSGRDPAVIDAQGIGQVFNARVVGKGNLVADAWFNVNDTQRVEPRILPLLDKGEPFELSTGLSVDTETVANGAKHDGVPYEFITSNYRPDHLAILLDQKGACSVEDGCGVLVNELTHSDLERELTSLLRARFDTPAFSSGTVDGPWVMDLFQNRVVYSLGDEHFRLGFTRTRDKVTLSDDQPVKVMRVTQWKLVTNNANEEEDMTNLADAERKTLIDGLIANECCWEEEDRVVLNGFSDAKLERENERSQRQETVFNTSSKEHTDDQGTVHTWNTEKGEWDHKAKMPEKKEEETVVNKLDVKVEPAKPQTAEEWLNSAPAEVQNTFRYAQGIEAREKGVLVERLVANATDKDAAKKMLGNKSLSELQSLLTLLPQETSQPVDGVPFPSYMGASVPAVNVQSEFDDGDVLTLPVVNHDKEHEVSEAQRRA